MNLNLRTVFLVAVGACYALVASAAASEWTLDADGSWNVAANWSGPIPDNTNATAFFGSAITDNRTVSLADPSDSNITASQLAIDGHFGYLVELQPSQKLTLAGNTTASLLVPGAIGNARQTIDDTTFNSGAVIALPQDFKVRNDSSGVFTVNVPGSGSNVVLTKSGPGAAKLSLGYSGTAQVNINEGSCVCAIASSNDLVLNGGRIFSATSSTIHSITVGPAGGIIEQFAVAGPGGGGSSLTTANFISGDGLLTKEGLGRFRLAAAQSTFTGPVTIRGGELDASDLSQPLAHAARYDIAGAAGIFAGQIHLGSANLSSFPVTVGAGGVIIAPSGTGVGLATLTRGGNLAAAPGAVIAQTAAGGSASVPGLGPSQDLFLGIGATQNVAGLTVGAGTPWQGISGIANFSTTLNSTGSGSITANSDFTIQHYDQIFKLNNTSIASSGGRHAVTIAAPTAGSLSQGAAIRIVPAGLSTVGEGVTISGSPNLSGVSKFIVTNGVTFTISSAGVLGSGSTQAPVVEVQSGGDFTKTAVSNPSVSDTLGTGSAAATVIIKGAARVGVASPIDVSTPLGGKFIIESRLPSSVGLGSATTGIGVDSLTFATDGAAIYSTGSVEGQTLIAGGNAVANVPGTSSSLGTLNLRGGLAGTGVFTKGSGGTVTIDGAKSGFGGPGSQLRIDAGIVQLNNSSFDTGPNGPAIFISQSPRLGLPGIFSLPSDVDEGAKLTSDSVGILALRSDNSSLSGVNNSAAFIGADGTHSLTTSTLAPGQGGVYRLGGGVNTPVLNLTAANVLSGSSDVVIGMPPALFGSLLKNGNGTVVLQNSNSYSGITAINSQSTLAIEAVHGIGAGVAPAGPINIDGTMVLRAAGSLGQSGAITINYGGELQIDESVTNVPDRIPDATPIRLRGGTLSYFNTNSSSPPSTETIGQTGNGVLLIEGDSIIDLTPKSAVSTTKLSIGEIHRGLGTTLELVRFSGQPTVIGNGSAFVANGIIPWMDNDNGAVYTSSASGDIVSYTGPSPSQIEGATAPDNVQTTSSVDALTGDRTINSLKLFGNVDLGGHVLNVGTAPINGVASGALVLSSPRTIGSGPQTGFLTAGQMAFAPNSATPGELIMRMIGNPATIAASIIDNAGDDGVFGNADDLPVTVTLMSDGTVNMTGAHNSYTGGTFINRGTLNATTFIPGNITLHTGKLQIASSTPNVFVVGGDITVSNSANSSTATTPLIQVPTFSGPSTPSLASRAPFLLHGLTVTPGSIVNLRGDIAIMGTTDIRGAQLFGNANGAFVGYSSLLFRGDYIDDSKTVIHGRFSSTFVTNTYTDTTRFQSGQNVDVHATIADLPRFSAEMNTTVNFFGILSKSRTITNSSDAIVAAATGGKVRFMPGAIIDTADGWWGPVYDSDTLKFQGDSSGIVEFVEGFKLVQAMGTNHLADLGANSIAFEAPITLVTNHSDNLPNFDPTVLGQLPPNIYPGEINMRADGARWLVQSNPQTYNQKIDFAADTRIITNTALAFTADSAIGMGDKDNIMLSSSQTGLREGTQSGSLEKLGPADLTILGRLYVSNYTRMIVSEGRLLLSNKSYEGYGQMDVEVRSGAMLGGGNIDGTSGLLPGKLTIKPGGTLDPGNSPYGIISVIGDHPSAMFEANSVFSPDLGGTVPGELHDQLKMHGDLVLGDTTGLPILSPDLDYVPEIGDLIFIVRNDSASSTAGSFETISGVPLSQGGVFGLTSSTNGQTYYFQISYHGDTASGQFDTLSGNDIALQAIAVPEPCTLLLLGMGTISLLGYRKRSR